MPFAAALSLHPDASVAAGETIGQLLERHGPSPDLAVLFVTAAHRDELAAISAAVRTLLRPVTMLGAAAVSVIGGSNEAEEVPAMSLWAAWGLGDVEPVRLTAEASTLPDTVGADHTLLLLVDPFSFPGDAFLEAVALTHPGTPIIGGLASAASAPGGNVLLLDDARYRDGAVAVAVPSAAMAVSTVVSQGCRPVGSPFTVTRASGNVLGEIGGRPALERLQELAETLDPDDRALLSGGVHLGRVIDEHRSEHGRGDFLIRAVLGADRRSGALVVGEQIEVGATVQFQVRDAGSASEELERLLCEQHPTADAALVFTCNGRGRRFFGEADHDARTVHEFTLSGAVAGMFCAGEFGPVGGRTFLHGYTASVALFRDPSEDLHL